MNSYLQYLHREKLSYCTLYPNVSDHFPLELDPLGISHICLLKDLDKDAHIVVKTTTLAALKASFAPNDLCVFTLGWTVLIQLENSGKTGILNLGSWFEQFMNRPTLAKKIKDLYYTNTRTICTPFDFDIDDDREDSPLYNAHIFLIDVALKLQKQAPLLNNKIASDFQEQIRIHRIEDSWEGNHVPKNEKWSKNIEPSPSYIEASWCICQQDQVLLEIPFSWCSYSIKHDFMGSQVKKPIFYSQG